MVYQNQNCKLVMNPGRFGPIPVRSGRFGPGRFGAITKTGLP